ncbi:hypothetical protein AM218_00235 [Hymenobacter sp. DG25A]|nr:hypothetical protein AM218_00235 [Hymenobacter sp. DG25A]
MGCGSKEDEPQPAPVPAAEFALYRSIYYPATAETTGIRYAPIEIKTSGALSEQELTLHFSGSAGPDAITFTLPGQQLTSGLTGTYTLQSLPNPAEGVADVWYVFTRAEAPGSTQGSIYGSHMHQLSGYLKITAFDRQRRLISGEYEVTMDNISDPYDSNWGPSPIRRCNLEIGGSFKNMPLK